MRGTMLWFNETKDLGAMRTDEGERVEMSADAFMGGVPPVGRCAGKEIEFRMTHGEAGATPVEIVFVPEVSPRRARVRHGSR